jgi:hypothetical protein
MSRLLIHILPFGGTLLSHNHSNEAVSGVTKDLHLVKKRG